MSLHEIYLRALSYLPPVQARLETQIQHFMPILDPAFHENRYAQLLTLFCLDSTDRNKLRTAQKLLNRLEPICFAGSEAEKALWCVVAGYYLESAGMHDSSIAAYNEADTYGHSFHLPYMLIAEHHVLNTHLYDLAMENYDKAINCIYRYPPLDDGKRYVIAQAQAGTALALTMMHRPEDAVAALAKSELANDSEEYLHSSAFLHAVQGDSERAEKTLTAFRALNPNLCEHVANHIRMILDGTHIHFYVRPVPPGLPDDFWRWFREKEAAFQPLLDKGDTDSCGNILAEYINTLVPDEEDQMYASVELKDGKPEMILTACYSRSYAAMINAIISACPSDIRDRWLLTIQP